jgi:general secretion pathway protein A
MSLQLKARPTPDRNMDYFSILNLNKEPFSNSPDPDYFFNSQQHVSCLQKLELSLRLRRGLNVVIGEVGTGKTTLCRQLLRRFSDDSEIETHLILDPHFSTPHEFLLAVTEMLTHEKHSENIDDFKLKEHIKNALFTKGVDENKTVILVIDEGQKIPVFCLELMREFLNFETNDYKLLQIAIFAQREFDNTLKEHANFTDRINLYHLLKPMNFRDTRAMIQYRLNQSSAAAKRLALFTYPALWAIYRATNGYPRKIVNVCHRSILTMIIQNKSKANWFLVQSCIRRVFSSGKKRTWQFAVILLLVLVGTAFTIPKWLPNQTTSHLFKETEASKGLYITTINPPIAPVTRDDSESTITANASTTQAAEGPATDTPDKPSLPGTTGPELPDKAQLQSSATTVPEVTNIGIHEVPGVLGQMTVNRHETLGGLIQTIYGVFNRSYLQSVLRINPHITNPDTINVGDVILFPAIASHVEAQPLKRWWVQITEEDSLEAVFSFLRQQDTVDVLPARLIPFWNRTSGLHFSVLLVQPFFDEASAVNKLERLRSSGITKAEIVSEWDAHTVFYANPYLNINT